MKRNYVDSRRGRFMRPLPGSRRPMGVTNQDAELSSRPKIAIKANSLYDVLTASMLAREIHKKETSHITLFLEHTDKIDNVDAVLDSILYKNADIHLVAKTNFLDQTKYSHLIDLTYFTEKDKFSPEYLDKLANVAQIQIDNPLPTINLNETEIMRAKDMLSRKFGISDHLPRVFINTASTHRIGRMEKTFYYELCNLLSESNKVNIIIADDGYNTDYAFRRTLYLKNYVQTTLLSSILSSDALISPIHYFLDVAAAQNKFLIPLLGPLPMHGLLREYKNTKSIDTFLANPKCQQRCFADINSCILDRICMRDIKAQTVANTILENLETIKNPPILVNEAIKPTLTKEQVVKENLLSSSNIIQGEML